MKESEYKRMQREAKELEESTSRLEWEIEQRRKELKELGFDNPQVARARMRKLALEIMRHEKQIRKRQKAYDWKWLESIEAEED